MDGEFTVEESFAVQQAVGGGNIIILGTDEKKTLAAAGAATRAMRSDKRYYPALSQWRRAQWQQSGFTLQDPACVHQ